MEEAYLKQYRDLYENHWWWRAREGVIVEELRALGVDSARILDVGCGDALAFPALSEFGSVSGLEPEASVVSNAHRDRVHIGPFDASFRCDESFELLTMLDVLEHLDNPLAALQKALGCLVPGGHLLLTVPAFRVLWTSHDDLNHHRTRYRRGTLFPLLEEAGLEVLRTRYLFQWTVPVKLLLRAFEGVVRSKGGPPGVPWSPLNRALLSWSMLEASMARILRPPFGSSLCVLARRPR